MSFTCPVGARPMVKSTKTLESLIKAVVHSALHNQSHMFIRTRFPATGRLKMEGQATRNVEMFSRTVNGADIE